MKHLLLLSVAFASPAWADQSQLVVPDLSRRALAAADHGPLHDRYEAAWLRYEKAIADVKSKVNTAMNTEFARAVDADNDALAEMWDKMKRIFSVTGSLSWPTDGKTKEEWGKKYSGAIFPEDFSAVVASAHAEFEKAVTALKEECELLVIDYAKAGDVTRAQALRSELVVITAQQVTSAQWAVIAGQVRARDMTPAGQVGAQGVLRSDPVHAEVRTVVLQATDANGVATNLWVAVGDEVSYSAQGEITLAHDDMGNYPYTSPNGNPAQMRLSEKWNVQGANGCLLMVIDGKVCAMGAAGKVVSPGKGRISFYLLENGRYPNNRGSYNVTVSVRRRSAAYK